MNNGACGWAGKRVNRVLSAVTGQSGEKGECARKISTPMCEGSVLEVGRVSFTDPSDWKTTCFRER